MTIFVIKHAGDIGQIPDGTKEDPTYVYLENDLDLSMFSIIPEGHFLIFEGNDHTISGSPTALFLRIYDSTVYNLRISLPTVIEAPDYMAFANQAYRCAFEAVTVTGKSIITIGNYHGIVRISENCEFRNCINKADVTVAGNEVCGINNIMIGGIIESCANYGNLTAVDSDEGMASGISLYFIGNALRCENHGHIRARNVAVGLIYFLMRNAHTKILKCRNCGSVANTLPYVVTVDTTCLASGLIGVASDIDYLDIDS
jgi:hypothetical protein